MREDNDRRLARIVAMQPHSEERSRLWPNSLSPSPILHGPKLGFCAACRSSGRGWRTIGEWTPWNLLRRWLLLCLMLRLRLSRVAGRRSASSKAQRISGMRCLGGRAITRPAGSIGLLAVERRWAGVPMLFTWCGVACLATAAFRRILAFLPLAGQAERRRFCCFDRAWRRGRPMPAWLCTGMVTFLSSTGSRRER